MRVALAAAARRAAATPRRALAAAAAPRRATYVVTSEAGTAALAAALAGAAAAPVAVCLYGDVGAGKSAFARAFVRAAAGDGELAVPSPTYLLHNVYDDVDGPPVHHFDLYRLGGAGGDRVSAASRGASDQHAPSLSPLDADRVGLAAALAGGVCLIEWADRLGDAAPAARLDVALEPLGEAAAAAAAAATGLAPPSPSDDPYADARWRRVTLTQHGGNAAVAALAAGAEGAVDGVSVARDERNE